MKSNKMLLGCIITLVALVITLAFTGCAQDDSGEVKDKNDATTPPGTQEPSETGVEVKSPSERDNNYLTSDEALKLAYDEAKEWSSDAIFKSMTIGTDLGLHYDWTETDMSYSWSVNFISPEKKQLLIVYVNYGKVYDTRVSDDSLKNMPKEGHPNDRPLMTLKEAYAVALKEGAISGLMPVNVEYRTYGYSDNDFPYWSIVFKVPVTKDTYERHFYYINAESGKLTDKIYKDNENDTISEAELKVNGNNLLGLSWMEDQRHMVIKFFTLINEGNTKDAVNMMDDNMVPNQDMKDMWIKSLSSISGHEFIQGGFTNEDEGSWTEDTQRFKVKINIPETCNCESFGWDHGQNTRWITMVKYEDQWKIHELSTSP